MKPYGVRGWATRARLVRRCVFARRTQCSVSGRLLRWRAIGSLSEWFEEEAGPIMVQKAPWRRPERASRPMPGALAGLSTGTLPPRWSHLKSAQRNGHVSSSSICGHRALRWAFPLARRVLRQRDPGPQSPITAAPDAAKGSEPGSEGGAMVMPKKGPPRARAQPATAEAIGTQPGDAGGDRESAAATTPTQSNACATRNRPAPARLG